jgi:hypothetical protein
MDEPTIPGRETLALPIWYESAAWVALFIFPLFAGHHRSATELGIERWAEYQRYNKIGLHTGWSGTGRDAGLS